MMCACVCARESDRWVDNSQQEIESKTNCNYRALEWPFFGEGLKLLRPPQPPHIREIMRDKWGNASDAMDHFEDVISEIGVNEGN